MFSYCSWSGNFVKDIMFAKCIIILTLILHFTKCARVLVISPTSPKSHQIVFRTLIHELINSDHEVTALTTAMVYPDSEIPNNLHEINVQNITRAVLVNQQSGFENPDVSEIKKDKYVAYVLSKMFIEQLKDESVVNIIADTTVKFDLLIIDNSVHAALIFSHILKVPAILMSTLGALPGGMKMIGSETHPLIYPIYFHRNLYNLNVWEKISELYNDIVYKKMYDKQDLHDDNVLKSMFGDDTPTIKELRNNVQMLFLNSHPIWSHNQPVPPNLLNYWGLHKKSGKMLPNDLQSYLDSSKRGVIYMSFGSVFQTSKIPPEIVNIFVKVFSGLPCNILLKWDTDELPGRTNNTKIGKWFPQHDVLRHPNVKLFITHGGLGSVEEAIITGVPIIGIPIFADQGYNVEKCVYFKIGIKLDYKKLSIENLENAIRKILANYDSYKRNIIQLRELMYDQPKPALDQIMSRIEYILRHGGAEHLRAPAANMSWIQYYEIELMFLTLSGSIVIVTLLLLLIKTCLNSVLCKIKLSFHKNNIRKVR